VKLASFNLENLFSRSEVMNLDTWAKGKDVLTDVERLNTLIAKAQIASPLTGQFLLSFEFYIRQKERKKAG
jgi:hypothetical protein